MVSSKESLEEKLKSSKSDIKEQVQLESETQIENGLSTEYHANGKKRLEVPYKDWRKEGIEFQWNDNGIKMLKARYKDGELEGLFTCWHENGQKKGEGQYKDDKKYGLWTYWDEEGEIAKTETYKDGPIEDYSTESDVEYLDSERAAKVLNVSLSKLFQMRKYDGLPHIKNGRKVLYRKSTLIAFLNNLERFKENTED